VVSGAARSPDSDSIRSKLLQSAEDELAAGAQQACAKKVMFYDIETFNNQIVHGMMDPSTGVIADATLATNQSTAKAARNARRQSEMDSGNTEPENSYGEGSGSGSGRGSGSGKGNSEDGEYAGDAEDESPETRRNKTVLNTVPRMIRLCELHQLNPRVIENQMKQWCENMQKFNYIMNAYTVQRAEQFKHELGLSKSTDNTPSKMKNWSKKQQHADCALALGELSLYALNPALRTAEEMQLLALRMHEVGTDCVSEFHKIFEQCKVQFAKMKEESEITNLVRAVVKKAVANVLRPHSTNYQLSSAGVGLENKGAHNILDLFRTGSMHFICIESVPSSTGGRQPNIANSTCHLDDGHFLVEHVTRVLRVCLAAHFNVCYADHDAEHARAPHFLYNVYGSLLFPEQPYLNNAINRLFSIRESTNTEEPHPIGSLVSVKWDSARLFCHPDQIQTGREMICKITNYSTDPGRRNWLIETAAWIWPSFFHCALETR